MAVILVPGTGGDQRLAPASVLSESGANLWSSLVFGTKITASDDVAPPPPITFMFLNKRKLQVVRLQVPYYELEVLDNTENAASSTICGGELQ